MDIVAKPLVAAILFAVSAAILMLQRRRISSTTLLRPWLWAEISLGFASAVEWLVYFNASGTPGTNEDFPSWVVASRFVSATGFLLPIVSLLGAKRPQDRAWHLIVLSLWVILVLPAAETYLLRQGSTIQIHDARGWFLWILILTGLVSYLPTRHRLATVFFAGGQILLLGDYLPFLRSFFAPRNSFCALAAFLVLLGVGAATYLRYRPFKSQLSQLNDDWCTFCDAYGFLWGMRVAERANATPGGCNSRLAWRRVEVSDDEDAIESEKAQVALSRTVRSHLMRFVSEDWLSFDGERND